MLWKKGAKEEEWWRWCVCVGGGVKYTGVGGVAVHATLKCNMHKK